MLSVANFRTFQFKLLEMRKVQVKALVISSISSASTYSR